MKERSYKYRKLVLVLSLIDANDMAELYIQVTGINPVKALFDLRLRQN